MAADLDTLQTRLEAAELAYYKLMTGSLRESVDHNGTRITYNKADAAALKQYIADLQGSVSELTAVLTGTTLVRRQPIGILY